ncbi:hypothetical protein ACFLRT_04775, partial [Acidobacteriota bacterium]
MKKFIVLLILITLPLLLWQCDSSKSEDQDKMIAKKESPAMQKNTSAIPDTLVKKVTDALVAKHGNTVQERARKGVSQIAKLWKSNDGSDTEFEAFCLKHFIAAEEERETVFKKISRNFEILLGHFNKITLDLQEPLHLDAEEIHPIDQTFGGYSVSSHLDEDFYQNKIAFITALNFPFYSLEEKTKLGPDWSGKEWAYARLGDFYISRVPPKLWQNYSEVNTNADMYISEYNIYMGSLLNDKGEKLFPKDLILLTHWNLRDELKSHYSDPKGMEKQQMIYKVMNRIIAQEIPQKVINSGDLDWNPVQNKVFRDGKEIEFEPEPDSRYQHLLNNFNALKATDAYFPPALDTYIKRNFDRDMEISQPEVEALFIELISSPQVKKVAQLIRTRLGRDLEPFDIWYDGFRPGSTMPEGDLNQITKKRYPTAKAMEEDLPNILMKLGFSKEKTAFLSSKIVVEAARGSGHAWGAEMRAEKAHLRTRVPADGMNYKGYNIAVHEFGHNVEQIISLHDVDYYIMKGVPNTAFTEALAYMFQKRDLELLGLKETDPNKKHLITLDTLWNVYEIMGVSLVDMRVWKWMYEHPHAAPAQLKEAVIQIAVDVWNKYFAEVMGVKDQSILAIYSHMISYPLYLSAYSYGHLIDFQVEQYISEKDFAAEVERMFSAGRLVPQLWMKRAVGEEISIE